MAPIHRTDDGEASGGSRLRVEVGMVHHPDSGSRKRLDTVMGVPPGDRRIPLSVKPLYDTVRSKSIAFMP